MAPAKMSNQTLNLRKRSGHGAVLGLAAARLRVLPIGSSNQLTLRRCAPWTVGGHDDLLRHRSPTPNLGLLRDILNRQIYRWQDLAISRMLWPLVREGLGQGRATGKQPHKCEHGQ